LTVDPTSRYAFSMTLETISSTDALEALLATSNERPVLLFKHSNSCGISSRALKQVEQFLADHSVPALGFGMVVVQADRVLSDAIAEQLGVPHATPQAIVIRDGRAVWTASHFDVTGQRLNMALGGL
jgi:bacillithiol system protein YtxJ